MARVVINRAALRQVLMGQQGPVGRDLALKSQRIVNAAKRRCPVDRGRLRSSIRYTLIVDDKGLYSLIGTDVEYAIFVHEGTRPHFPPPGKLQPWAGRHGFPGGLEGGFMVARGIAAYGTKGHPFLTDALASVNLL